MNRNMEYDKFLAETKYCDISNPAIQSKSKMLISSCKGDEVCFAIRIFNWVRDEVKYGFDFWNVKASETMKKMFGMCANKANLQIAMLRAVGIPAGYGILRIKKEALRTTANDEIYEKSADIIIHVYCCANLNGRWISADATVDKELYEVAYLEIPYWNYKDWDGKRHFRISDYYIVEDMGLHADIDIYMDIPPRFLDSGIIDRANRYITQLRRKVKAQVGNL